MSAAEQLTPETARDAIRARFALDYRGADHRRLIAGEEVIVHCHHYNARIQRTVESAASVDGKSIIRNVAESVFCRHLQASFAEGDDEAQKWAVASELFAHLGYGRLDFSKVDEGVVAQSSGHFVEGFAAAFGDEARPVCTLAEGFIQAAFMAIRGELVDVRESACMHCGASACAFGVDAERKRPFSTFAQHDVGFSPRPAPESAKGSNVDEPAIIGAVVGLPIFGNDEGLIPAFGVYLANTPAEFYNLVAIEFVEKMAEAGQEESARRLLIEAGESCAMNTFRGIMNSPEWEALVQPMLAEERDTVYALVALSNAFGWGNWQVVEHEPEEMLRIHSFNGYEALGYLQAREGAEEPQCWMLQGVSAGMMELVYGEGSFSERFGTYITEEEDCIAAGSGVCSFYVEAA